MDHERLSNGFFFLMLLGVVVVTCLIFLPYLNALVIAGVFAILFRPLFRIFTKRMPRQVGFSALLTLLIVVILIVIPLFFFGRQVVVEASNVLSGDTGGFIDTLYAKFGDTIRIFYPSYTIGSGFDTKELIQSILGWVIGHVGSVFASLTQVFITIFVALVAFFYFLRDGTKIKQALIELSPLPNKYDQEIFDRLHLAVNSVIRGSLVIAVIQGILAGVGFALFGIPNPALWGLIAMIAALIPGVGTALVLIPAILYAFFAGTLVHAIGLLIWGSLAVGLIDNFLGPRLVGRRIKIHELLILLSVLGGLGLFGPLGFLIGPLVLSLLFALLDIYKNLILPDIVHTKTT